jgi:hypothetical protein
MYLPVVSLVRLTCKHTTRDMDFGCEAASVRLRGSAVLEPRSDGVKEWWSHGVLQPRLLFSAAPPLPRSFTPLCSFDPPSLLHVSGILFSSEDVSVYPCPPLLTVVSDQPHPEGRPHCRAKSALNSNIQECLRLATAGCPSLASPAECARSVVRAMPLPVAHVDGVECLRRRASTPNEPLYFVHSRLHSRRPSSHPRHTLTHVRWTSPPRTAEILPAVYGSWNNCCSQYLRPATPGMM